MEKYQVNSKIIELENGWILKCEISMSSQAPTIKFLLYDKVDNLNGRLLWTFNSAEAMRLEMAEMVKGPKTGHSNNWCWSNNTLSLFFYSKDYAIQDRNGLGMWIPGFQGIHAKELKTFLIERFGEPKKPEVKDGDVLLYTIGDTITEDYDDRWLVAAGGKLYLVGMLGKPFDIVPGKWSLSRHYRNGEIIWERK